MAAAWSPVKAPAAGDAPGKCVYPDGSVTVFAPGKIIECEIPPGVTRIKAIAWGAQGGNGPKHGNGVAGGYAVRTLDVVPGLSLYRVIGGQMGGNGRNGNPFVSDDGGGGGAASGIYTALPPQNLDQVVVIAGGGGGGGGCDDGGVGGGTPAAPRGNGAGQNGYGGSAGGGGLGKGGTSYGYWQGTGGSGLGGSGGQGYFRIYGGWGGTSAFTGNGGDARDTGGGGGGGYGGGAGGSCGGGGGGGSYPASLSDRYSYGNGVVSMQAVGPGLGVPRCELRATEKGQRHFGTPADERICSRGGADNVFADEGDDVIIGGPGADHMHGGKGFDVCNGGPGADVAYPSCEKVISAKPSGS
jgi:hypothetical protein